MRESGEQSIDTSTPNIDERIANLVQRLEETGRELEAERARRQGLEQRHKEDLKRIQELERVAMIDPLTGLLNRRGADLAVERILDERGARPEGRERRAHDQHISILTLDIDHFKKVNDTYGHAVGDAVLRAVSEKLKRGFRRKDLVIRDGGEEITCVLMGVDARTAYHVLFQKFGNAGREFGPSNNPQIGFPVDVKDAQGNTVTLQITFSGGIVDFKEDRSLKETKDIADALLYKAKQEGRNRILMPDPADTTG